MRGWLRRLFRRGGAPDRTAPWTARDMYLLHWTDEDSVEWVARVQDFIEITFRDNPADPNHPLCDVADWLVSLVYVVEGRIHAKARELDHPIDENIAAASVLAVVLATWASRIRHAKAYDPNRPIDLRLGALDVHATFVEALIDGAIGETRDAEYFPAQEWNPPYGRSARGGDFV